MTRRNKKPIPRALRLQVFERDNYTCRYCGRQTDRPHCDHVYPESRGGATELGNLVTACHKCNRASRHCDSAFPTMQALGGHVKAAHKER